MLYSILVHTHSGIRWIALLFIVLAFVSALIKIAGKKDYGSPDKKFSLITLISFHLQLIIGLVLFFISPKVIFSAESMSNSLLRFFLVEHTSLMLIAIVLITIGYSKAKKTVEPLKKHRRIALYYGIALFLILIAIPWPWRELSAAWF